MHELIDPKTLAALLALAPADPTLLPDILRLFAESADADLAAIRAALASSLRPDFERLAALPFDKLIGGHGGLASSGAQALLAASIEREL